MIKNSIRRIIKFIISLPIYFVEAYTKVLSYIHPSFSNMIYSLALEVIDERKIKIEISPNKFLLLHTPNSVCKMRANTFFNKEPETLEWLEQFSKKEQGSGPVLIDIGANIGIYSIYNALKFGNKNILFEPSPLNIKQLFKNINVNNISELCHVSTVPLSSEISKNIFNISNLDDGGALSGFGVNYGFDGNSFKTIASMNTIGITLDKYLDLFSPIKQDENYIVKLDVDGIEHLILKGASKTLKSQKCLSILVEVNVDFIEQKDQIEDLLFQYGFTLERKRQSEVSRNSKLFSTSFNYIYYKQ